MTPGEAKTHWAEISRGNVRFMDPKPSVATEVYPFSPLAYWDQFFDQRMPNSHPDFKHQHREPAL